MTAGVDGILFDIFLGGEKVGETCVTEQEAAQQEQVTPGRVLRAFRSLTWPQSDLVIQPPGGQTLVNFATNFYTDNDQPSRQSVSLLNQDVLIEATPTSYTWRFGDGTTSSTSTPGAAYPALEVTHDYATVGAFAPSLDTTYTGRYRLNGGPWIAIPETLTVPGVAQQLETIAARPTLVDY
ncbi:PKD domain-containing protein [Nocardioides sp.]|uniref:PKD domain-containing protein n=1 Tax=Nocardioides sp. TaxID=35761 RepID=UPI002B2696F3|nr:PKD domain-containing protein [Nocardioides sp.]